MSKIFFLEPSWFGTGLTNQIFFIIYAIINCINNNKKNLVINNFRLEPLTDKFCGINEIIDIHYLNILLKKYDLFVYDIGNIVFNIDSVIYGLNDTNIDITKEILRLFYKNNKLFIPIGTNLNNIGGDPFPGQEKKLYITYTINQQKTIEEYSEYIHKHIIIDLQNPTNISSWEEIDNCYINNTELFDYLLKNIKFNNRLVKYSENALLIDAHSECNHLPLLNLKDKKVNVLHLRVEKDMTGHMLTHNKMTQEEYDIQLQDKYIELIKKYFSKDDIVFVLSYDLSNNVTNFLNDSGYEFYITKKNIFGGREQHAIIDLLIGEKCNNYYIGNWNFDIRQGSTFSYFLYVRNNAVNNIFIDMYDIQKSEILKINYVTEKLKSAETLKELVNNLHTDKNTLHSYLDLYQELLCSKKNTAKNILEIGIGYYYHPNGGSIKLWYDYFLNANIYALDIQHIDNIWDEIKNKNRIKLLTSTDAYDEVKFNELFLDKNIKFDMILDDGPHTLETMIQFIKLYSQIMTEDGILIIEDVQSINWIDDFVKVVPENLKKYIQVYDLRHERSCGDNIVFVINKNINIINNYNYVVTKFNQLCTTPLDINEHLPTLYKYAKECNSILECGVRGCVSSWAFTYGLIDGDNKSGKSLILNDLVECDINELLNNTKNINRLNIDYKWCSDLDLKLDQNVDMIFIDTYHVYGQLKRELDKFSKLANKYIIMHDTNVDEIYGECIRVGDDPSLLSKSTNIPVNEILKGLKFAINEFLENNNDWVLHEIFINNNGLTILKKIENHNKKLLPISFSIPEEKICKNIDISIKTKIEAFVKPSEDRNKKYKYDNEEDYYNDYKNSFFAHTCKRNGWDSLRHYEILANNCIPYFNNIDECPKNILCFYPKELIKESNKLYEKVKDLSIEDFVTNYEYINEYTNILQKLMIHTKKNLTTKSLANYILESSNNKPLNILFLSRNNDEDYLKSLTLHGFKSIFGSKCHDYPKIQSIYKSCNSNSLYGNGFTYSKLLLDDNYRDDTLDNTIEQDILSKKYDIIIYSQISIYYQFYDIISKTYEPSKVIFLNGEDHVTHFHLKDCNNKISKGHFFYIREFQNFNNYDYFIPFIKYFE
jgi:hypothetical protein